MSEATFYMQGGPEKLYCGWLGPGMEVRTWADAISNCGNPRVYREFHNVPWQEIQDRKVIYANREFTWDLERRLYKQGLLDTELLPTFLQDTGNCVAAALGKVGEKLQVIELALAGQEERFRPWYIPWIYAVSRNQIGGGMRGAGSTGAWGARAVNEYGVLFSNDDGVPPTNGTSDDWGNRRNAGDISLTSYGKFAPVAADNKVGMIHLTDVDQLVECMDAGMVATIASNQGFKLITYKGMHLYSPHGSWAHQMHITDMRREPKLLFYRMNQWGPDHTKPLNGETPGGAWQHAEDLANELKHDAELYAYFNFQGEPSGPRHDFV